VAAAKHKIAPISVQNRRVVMIVVSLQNCPPVRELNSRNYRIVVERVFRERSVTVFAAFFLGENGLDVG
jgi:hypothetical protein